MEIDEVLLVMCAGNDAEAEEAFTWLYNHTWEEVLRVLKSKRMVCSLTIDQKQASVNDAFAGLWKKARDGKIQDTDTDPRALLHRIAFRRGIDLVRKSTAQRRYMPPEEWEAFVDKVVDESSFGSQWKLLKSKGLAQEIMDDFLEWMEQQKGVCHRTALAMAEFLPDLVGLKELHETLCKEIDPPPTYESVKKARANVILKFKASIESKYEGMWRK